MRYLSVCSGMEAATVAWHNLGWTPVGFSEIEPFPSAILQHHYPTIKNYGDLTKFKEWKLERGSIDLLVGGTPCQAFSNAGLRKGLDDPRGNLALTFLALADHLRPKYILWENVPGVLSSSRGQDFGSFIGALAQLRYGFAWRICDAQHFGVAQRRKRVFLLAIEGAGEWRSAAEILFERKSLSGDFTESEQKGQSTPANVGTSIETSGTKPLMFKIRGGSEKNTGEQGGVIGQSAGKGFLGSEDKTFTIATTQDQWLATQEKIAYPINTMTLGGRPDPVNDARMTMGVGDNGDPQFTLQAAHSHAVAYNQDSHSMKVRKLTPIECERLQGFPDNYSQIDWNGKPANECPDGLRYKACGNSMAVPVMAFIGNRIQKHIDGTL